LGEDPTPYRSTVMTNTRPNQVVYIDETRCIGCTKCISACPVDAIVGATKLMHTVITDHCTGCELCIDPCPVDCIDIRIIPTPASKVKAFESRQRYEQRQQRIEQRQIERRTKHAIAKKQAKQSYILAAIGRVKEKKESYHVSSNE
jgi:Na+-translocating ferredoxin:NAD+ oxidoreductase subunit B